MEMKRTVQAQNLPTEPPPYSPPEASISSGVVIVPPAANAHGPRPMLQNTSPVHTTTVTGRILIPNAVGPIATPYVCPSCSHTIITRVEASTTVKQHLSAILLCGIGFWPCVCIPYLMPSCRKADHFCPICGSYIGTYVG